jgi:hypothetical protein
MIMSIFERVINKVLRIFRIDFLLFFVGPRSYLKTSGWFKSSFKKKCLDKNGKAIPWWAYGATKFLENKIKSDLKVFEYGAGYSTLWLANKVADLTSIDDDQIWISLLKSKIPSNVNLIYSETENIKYGHRTFLPINQTKYKYSKEIDKFNKKFDIIIIDGVDRNNCIVEALKNLSSSGVIILDNLELSYLMTDAIDLIYKDGFKLLDFWGISPGVSHESGTGIFYKAENCLGI